MLAKTKYFGEVDFEEDKILTFENGIFGFEQYHRFILLYGDKEKNDSISWFQSLDEPNLALPVISPSLVMEEYNPTIEDELLKSLGDLKLENLIILLTLTVPKDLTKMTTNLKAPLVINIATKRGCQVVAENKDYMVKYPVYEIFSKMSEQKGEL